MRMKRILIFVFLVTAVVTLPADLAMQAHVATAFRGQCEELLLAAVQRAQKEVLVACYSFSRRSLADALIEKAGQGITVRIKMDAGQAQSEPCEETVAKLQSSAADLRLISMPEKRAMHNKFVVIDRRWVLTGSYNFTTAATDGNWENIVQIESPDVAERFAKEWQKIANRKERE